MTTRTLMVGVAMLFAAAISLPAHTSAQTLDQQWAWCSDARADSVRSCTAVIQSGQQTQADLAGAFYNRGKAYSGMRQYNLAIRDYDEAIRLNSYYAPAFNGRGNAYAALRQYDLAIRDYSDSIWLNPTEAIPFNNRGLAYEKLGTSIDVNSPVNAFQQVIDQNVRNNASAMKDFDEAVRLDPNFASAIYNRAVLFRYLGQQGRASAEFAKARQLNPNLPPPQDNGVQVR